MSTTPSPLALSIASALTVRYGIVHSFGDCIGVEDVDLARTIDTILLPRLVAHADKLEAAVGSPPEICGLCGGPILPDDEAKTPHPVCWPGERESETDIVHTACEDIECSRAHMALTDAQRAAFLKSL